MISAEFYFSAPWGAPEILGGEMMPHYESSGNFSIPSLSRGRLDLHWVRQRPFLNGRQEEKKQPKSFILRDILAF